MRPSPTAPMPSPSQTELVGCAPTAQPARRVQPARRARPADAVALPLALLLGLVLALSGASSASASSGEVLSRLNGARQASGLAPLSSSSDLDGVAQAWAETMASEGQLRHNPSLSSAVSGWSAIAENVGMGGSVSVVHDALMASSAHRTNILGSYAQVGVGVASGDGSVWVVQVFRTPSGAPAPAPPRPAPAPAPAPAPPPPPPPPPPAAPASRPAAPTPARPAAPEASRSDVPAADPATPVAVPAPPAPVAAAPVALPPAATAAALEVSAAMRAIGGRGPWRISQPFVV